MVTKDVHDKPSHVVPETAKSKHNKLPCSQKLSPWNPGPDRFGLQEADYQRFLSRSDHSLISTGSSTCIEITLAATNLFQFLNTRIYLSLAKMCPERCDSRYFGSQIVHQTKVHTLFTENIRRTSTEPEPEAKAGSSPAVSLAAPRTGKKMTQWLSPECLSATINRSHFC